MRTYKIISGDVGPWPEGTIITQKDLDAYPGLGGTKRLIDLLGVIEEHVEVPDEDDGKPAPVGKFIEVKGVEKDADPNAPSRSRRGKS